MLKEHMISNILSIWIEGDGTEGKKKQEKFQYDVRVREITLPNGDADTQILGYRYRYRYSYGPESEIQFGYITFRYEC